MSPKFAIALALFLFLIGSAGAQTLRQQQQREASQKQVEILWQEATQKLSSVSVNSSALTEDARRELARLNDELKTAQDMAGRKVGAMKAADSQDWERFKAEAYAAIADLDRIYGRMQSLKK